MVAAANRCIVLWLLGLLMGSGRLETSPPPPFAAKAVIRCVCICVFVRDAGVIAGGERGGSGGANQQEAISPPHINRAHTSSQIKRSVSLRLLEGGCAGACMNRQHVSVSTFLSSRSSMRMGNFKRSTSLAGHWQRNVSCNTVSASACWRRGKGFSRYTAPEQVLPRHE